jgi:hypothetical protein
MASNCGLKRWLFAVLLVLLDTPWIDAIYPESYVSEFKFDRQHQRSGSELLSQLAEVLQFIEYARPLYLHQKLRERVDFPCPRRSLKSNKRFTVHKRIVEQKGSSADCNRSRHSPYEFPRHSSGTIPKFVMDYSTDFSLPTALSVPTALCRSRAG